jgi:glycosyltransferase involved in cell wall biosynthesis
MMRSTGQNSIPTVSVILPVHNAALTLARCVDSVVAQTAEGVELIIVDDGSTDGSREIAEGYVKAYPGMARLINLEGGGVSAARNAGVRAARGTYVGFVDSDDHIAPDMYAHLLGLMDDGQSDMAVCAKYVEGGGPLRIKEHAKPFRGNVDFSVETPEQLSFLIENVSNFVWDKLLRADIIRTRSLRFPEAFSYSEDFAFLAVYLSYAKRVVFTDRPCYYYNVNNPLSISNTPSERWPSAFGSFGAVIDDFRRRSLPEPVILSVCRVAFRTYDHRANSFYRFARKDVQRGYIRAAFEFFDCVLPDWRGRIVKDSGVLFPRIKASPFFMSLYVAAPNALKALVMRPVERRAERRNPFAEGNAD